MTQKELNNIINALVNAGASADLIAATINKLRVEPAKKDTKKAAAKESTQKKVDYVTVKGEAIQVLEKDLPFLEGRKERYLARLAETPEQAEARKAANKAKQAEFESRWDAWRASAAHDKKRNREVAAMIREDIKAGRESKF